MDKPPSQSKTLGQAVDELISALGSIDEASRVTALKAACDHLKIQMPLIPSTQQTTAEHAQAAPPIAPGASGGRIVDIKSLKNEKQPTSANEMAAIVAYYLSELAQAGEKKSEVATEDMNKYFKQAGFPLPKRPEMLLSNAKNAGYFDAGSYGNYKLSPVGYNLVAHNLPRTGGTGAPAANRGTKRKAHKPATNKTKRLKTK